MRDLPSPPVLTSPSQGEICDEIFPNYDDQLSQHSIEDQFSSNIAASQPVSQPESSPVLIKCWRGSPGIPWRGAAGGLTVRRTVKYKDEMETVAPRLPATRTRLTGSQHCPRHTRKLGTLGQQTEYLLHTALTPSYCTEYTSTVTLFTPAQSPVKFLEYLPCFCFALLSLSLSSHKQKHFL